MLHWGKDAAGALRSVAAAVGDLIVPPVCLACHRPLSSHDCICPDCWSDIDFIRAPLCDRLGIPLPFDVGGPMISAAAAADPPDYDRARAVARFDGVMRQLVHDLKFRDRHDARRLFGRWLTEAGAELLADADVVVPGAAEPRASGDAPLQPVGHPGGRGCAAFPSAVRAAGAAAHQARPRRRSASAASSGAKMLPAPSASERRQSHAGRRQDRADRRRHHDGRHRPRLRPRPEARRRRARRRSGAGHGYRPRLPIALNAAVNKPYCAATGLARSCRAIKLR